MNETANRLVKARVALLALCLFAAAGCDLINGLTNPEPVSPHRLPTRLDLTLVDTAISVAGTTTAYIRASDKHGDIDIQTSPSWSMSDSTVATVKPSTAINTYGYSAGAIIAGKSSGIVTITVNYFGIINHHTVVVTAP